MAYNQGSMTAIRVHEEPRTICDFSGKCSKNKIRQALRTCQITNIEGNTLYDNRIKVGMYTITIWFPFDLEGPRKLREFRDFEIVIFDGEKQINLKTDPRFRGQYWVQHNFFGKLKIKHLIDIIIYCQRLDKLKAFL